MKKLYTLISLSIILSCAKADYWTQKAPFPGSNRVGPFCFSIGTKGYIGCGYDIMWTPTRSFWQYDQVSNSWTQKADFGDSARVYATGFAIGSYGYAGIGVSPAAGWMQDFHKYDPANNSWAPIDSFPGGGRSEACSFVINNKAYVGTGIGSVAPYIFNDLWEYDPAAGAWTAKAPFPGQARSKAVGVAAGNLGYIVTGFSTSTYFSDLWQYNASADTWTPKSGFTFDPRGGAAGFSLYNKLDLGTGNNKPTTGSNYASKDWWLYDPVTNTWTQKTSFLGSARYETGFFAIGNKGYVCTGANANVQYSDCWEYTPDIPSDVNEIQGSDFGLQVFPNPVKELLAISFPLPGMETIDITITDANGKKVYLLQQAKATGQLAIDLRPFTKGIYFIEVSCAKQKAVKKFVKE